jgi:hypothetical protein
VTVQYTVVCVLLMMNELTVRNILIFYYSVFSFVERHLVNFECVPSSDIAKIHFVIPEGYRTIAWSLILYTNI